MVCTPQNTTPTQLDCTGGQGRLQQTGNLTKLHLEEQTAQGISGCFSTVGELFDSYMIHTGMGLKGTFAGCANANAHRQVTTCRAHRWRSHTNRNVSIKKDLGAKQEYRELQFLWKLVLILWMLEKPQLCILSSTSWVLRRLLLLETISGSMFGDIKVADGGSDRKHPDGYWTSWPRHTRTVLEQSMEIFSPLVLRLVVIPSVCWYTEMKVVCQHQQQTVREFGVGFLAALDSQLTDRALKLRFQHSAAQ